MSDHVDDTHLTLDAERIEVENSERELFKFSTRRLLAHRMLSGVGGGGFGGVGGGGG